MVLDDRRRPSRPRPLARGHRRSLPAAVTRADPPAPRGALPRRPQHLDRQPSRLTARDPGRRLHPTPDRQPRVLPAEGDAVHDDINHRAIPGVDDFGELRHADEPFPLSFVEQYIFAEASAELIISVHNGHLLLGALGLGGWTFDGIDRLSILGASGNPDVPGLGFHVRTDDRWAIPNPTGLPGVFETLSRPHIPDIATAVRLFTERKYAIGGPFHPDTPGPWRETPAVRSAAARHDQRFLDLLTLEAIYIDDTFGKLPSPDAGGMSRRLPRVSAIASLCCGGRRTDAGRTPPGAPVRVCPRNGVTDSDVQASLQVTALLWRLPIKIP